MWRLPARGLPDNFPEENSNPDWGARCVTTTVEGIVASPPKPSVSSGMARTEARCPNSFCNHRLLKYFGQSVGVLSDVHRESRGEAAHCGNLGVEASSISVSLESVAQQNEFIAKQDVGDTAAPARLCATSGLVEFETGPVYTVRRNTHATGVGLRQL